jgi:hypothetical protein
MRKYTFALALGILLITMLSGLGRATQTFTATQDVTIAGNYKAQGAPNPEPISIPLPSPAELVGIIGGAAVLIAVTIYTRKKPHKESQPSPAIRSEKRVEPAGREPFSEVPSEAAPAVSHKQLTLCPSCGESLPNRPLKFCPFCGFSLEPDESKAKGEPKLV